MYIYYYWTKKLLKEIHRRDKITNNGREIVTFSLLEQQLFKNTIIKFIPSFKNFDFQFHVIEYRINLISSLYGAYKFAESTLAILYIQAQMRDNWE